MTTLIDNTKPRKEAAEGIEQSQAVASSPSTPQSLYSKRVKLYPKLAHGFYRNIKWFALFTLLGIYYITPWIRWDRGLDQPSQAVLVDFENARFYFFFIEIWPQEVYYITGLLILAALGLFLATSLFGRVWCGYACPQTIWTDLFIQVEKFFEGDRNARMKLDKAPWSLKKVYKKSAKHITWVIIAALTGGAWILYFHDAPTIARNFLSGHAPMTSYVFAALLTFTTYWLAGHMREQVCTYMCPWPRIQAALIDEDALNVTYRYDRGEPRGAHKKGTSWEGRGDCIDCRQCVVVCPVGIDIRNGLQLECIGCALCIDACDEVMVKVDRPKGLIAYDTDANVQRRMQGKKSRYNLIRPRTVTYAVLVVAVGGIMLYSLLNRVTLDMNILRDRQPNYVSLSDGGVRNGYTLKILNKSSAPRRLALSADTLPSPVITVAGQRYDGEIILTAPADDTLDFKIYLSESEILTLDQKTDFEFTLVDKDTGETTTAHAIFISGGPK
ncbi:cytochrome c oxidase accessory protein CcoG [Robiginitomaculum antarcticum]|uniref:cytochrome c oxidase accessory protein CcoG n=1 Tax=Robiginitomaculum antarcticum TaxID=437507 RepID=UPI00036BF6CB|nr:cytochrome c oxidase accessory protein CcoG [Robiginitomaculum antarcticum]